MRYWDTRILGQWDTPILGQWDIGSVLPPVDCAPECPSGWENMADQDGAHVPHVGLSGGEKPRRSQRASRSQLSSGILGYWVCAAACDGVLKALCVCTVHRALCVRGFSHRVCVRAAPLTLCGRVSERGGPWRHPRALISNCTCLRT